MKFKKSILNFGLALVSTLATLLVLEVGLKAYRVAFDRPHPEPTESRAEIPKYIIVDSPVIYALNPMHTEISSQGLRDNEVSIPKPEGELRIMLLGDSITYGLQVSRKRTFVEQLENRLQKEIKSAEVINTGVPGYTPYNELQYYLTEGRKFDPDIVIVAFCMNDVANPRLHWFYTQEKIADIPDAAIPNIEYDQNVILPKVQARKSIWHNSELFNTFEPLVSGQIKKFELLISGQKKNGDIPTFITGEDDLSIEVLLDKSSPEWQWITSTYDALHAAVRADNATFVIAIFPVAYQMDEGYPFFPQENLLEYCRRNDIPCIDLLPSFKNYSKADIFRLNRSEYLDIWHLTEFGHQVTAREMERFLREANLIGTVNQAG